jgi:two-component system chemotaxis response regulator CheB
MLVEVTATTVTVNGKAAMSEELELETRIANEDNALEWGVLELGDLTPYTCPECSGVMVQLKSGGIPRFRCHTGHAFSIRTLLAAVTDSVETEMWNTVRVLDESLLLMKHMGQHLRDRGEVEMAGLYEQAAEQSRARGRAMRQALIQHEESGATQLVRRKSNNSGRKRAGQGNASGRQDGRRRSNSKTNSRARKKARAPKK